MIKVISTPKDNKNVIFDLYVPIPEGSNSAKITWEAALIVAGYEVDNGYVVFRNQSYQFDTTVETKINDSQRLQSLTAANAKLVTEKQSELAAELRYTGYEIADS